MTILELDALTLEYDKQPVLSHIDLAVEKGELVSLLGHSGCGKTTLIKAIAGLHPLSGGRVLLQGQDACPRKNGGCRCCSRICAYSPTCPWRITWPLA